MPANSSPMWALPESVLDPLRTDPIHDVLRELSAAAVKLDVVGGAEFKKLLAYILDLADGRDRREPWVQRPGVVRPVPRLRVLIDECFGEFGDFQWFRLNRITNDSRRQLGGMFPRMAAAMGKASSEDIGRIVKALVAEDPIRHLQQLVHGAEGKLRGIGVELLSRIAYALRPDLYFLLPKAWGESSGCLRFIGADMRRYCAVARKLREICNSFEVEAAIRGGVLHAVMDRLPIPGDLDAALNRTLGPAMTRFTIPAANEAYIVKRGIDEHAQMPLDFAARAIVQRRGRKELRDTLLRSCDSCCAMTGPCPAELLEVAYVTPFPEGDVHSVMNALLLRADMHTLWDLNMVAVDPVSMRIRIADVLFETEYGRLEGKKLVKRIDGSRVSDDYLRERWATLGGERFKDRGDHGRGGGRVERPRRSAREGFPSTGGECVATGNGSVAVRGELSS